MRQTDFSLGNVTRRLNEQRSLFNMSVIISSCPPRDPLYVHKVAILKRIQRSKRQLRLLRLRSLRIHVQSFDIKELGNKECFRSFRFTEKEILSHLVPFVGWQQNHTTRNRYACTPLLATCVVLRRLATTNRWEDLTLEFGRHSSQLSEIFWESMEGIFARWEHLLCDWRGDLMSSRASLYASYVARVAPSTQCVGFLDVTKILVTRPGGSNLNQRALYSGHKRTWCLKFQTVSTPDGLMFNLYGPEDGRRHDTTLYVKSNMDSILSDGLGFEGNEASGSTPSEQYHLYADAAYVMRPWLQVAYPRETATPEQMVYNASMNAARTSVEWSYKDVKQNFTTVAFQRKMKVREAPVAIMYKVACIFWNLKVVLGHGSQAARYMTDDHLDVCPPPTWEEYVVEDNSGN